MTISQRGRTGHSTYFVTANRIQGDYIFRGELASLLIEVLYHYRAQKKFLLHGFVIMPDDLHLLISPISGTSLYRAMQLIKRGFSFRARLDSPLLGDLWQSDFRDQRIRDWSEYCEFQRLLHHIPVDQKLCEDPKQWPHSSIHDRFAIDPVPQQLKQ